MGCASSKRVEAAVDYKPAPASFAVFNINGIQEPWLGLENTTSQQEETKKPVHVPAQILDKLDESDAAAAPQTWDEVSKALENLKPNLSPKPSPAPSPVIKKEPEEERRKPRKSLSFDSFHTLEELDNKLTAPKTAGLKKSESMNSLQRKKPEPVNRSRSPLGMPSPDTQTQTESTVGYKSVKENIFIKRDRMERQKEGQVAVIDKLISLRDPLSDYPEKCPPGGAETVVIYTTSLRGVRRTYEDCQRVKSVFEVNRLVYDERDVSLHGEFLTELKGLVGEGLGVPRVFVKGRYVGGVEEVVELNESGRLGRIVKWARVETGVGPQACGGCGGARFVPCMECGGSCKVVIGDKKERCPKCNENGLVYCVACWTLT
ncbi:putative thioredoxin-like protein [Rosa chinensis]|uniref:Putative thioredoxin-like protein n=1 Tax=Rosa chinensis TaxID=74649 RepID=A0A2P6P610_ROSCH|nr:uncharacterized protein LOC112178564 [Rosa chinensis]PRQ17359.1 putative thioredoxin-like protein [Rosa chinensis]